MGTPGLLCTIYNMSRRSVCDYNGESSCCISPKEQTWILYSTYESSTLVLSYVTKIVKTKINLAQKIETYPNQYKICMIFTYLVTEVISFVLSSIEAWTTMLKYYIFQGFSSTWFSVWFDWYQYVVGYSLAWNLVIIYLGVW